jgi:PAS domain-containing protein
MTTDREPSGLALVPPALERQLELDALAERYRCVVEMSNDAILITDPERRIAFANPSAIALFGHGSALIGMSVARTVAEEMREEVRQRERSAASDSATRRSCGVAMASGARSRWPRRRSKCAARWWESSPRCAT